MNTRLEFGWQSVASTVNERLINGSLLHTLNPNKKIKKRTKALNERLKQYPVLKSYSKYVQIKKSVKKEFSGDDETDDEPNLTIEDYKRIHKQKRRTSSPVLLSSITTDRLPKHSRNEKHRETNELDSESDFFARTKKKKKKKYKSVLQDSSEPESTTTKRETLKFTKSYDNAGSFDASKIVATHDPKDSRIGNSRETSTTVSKSDHTLIKGKKNKSILQYFPGIGSTITNRERQKSVKLNDNDSSFGLSRLDTTEFDSLVDTILDIDDSADFQDSIEDARSEMVDAKSISSKGKDTEALKSLEEQITADENKVKINVLTKLESLDSHCNGKFHTGVEPIMHQDSSEDEDLKLTLSSESDESDGNDQFVKPKQLPSNNDNKIGKLRNVQNYRKLQRGVLENCKRNYQFTDGSDECVKPAKIKHKLSSLPEKLLQSQITTFLNPKKSFSSGTTEYQNSNNVKHSDESALSDSWMDTGNSENRYEHKTDSAQSNVGIKPEGSKSENKTKKCSSTAKRKLKKIIISESSDDGSEAFGSQVIEKKPVDVKRNLSAALENSVFVEIIQDDVDSKDKELTVQPTKSTERDQSFKREEGLEGGRKKPVKDSIPVVDRDDADGSRINTMNNSDIEQTPMVNDLHGETTTTKLSLKENQKFDDNSEKREENSKQRSDRHENFNENSIVEWNLASENSTESLQPSESFLNTESQSDSEAQKKKLSQWITKTEIISKKYRIIDNKLQAIHGHDAPKSDETVIPLERNLLQEEAMQSEESDSPSDDGEATTKMKHARGLEQMKIFNLTRENDANSDDKENAIQPQDTSWKTDKSLLQTAKNSELDATSVKNCSYSNDSHSDDENLNYVNWSPKKSQNSEESDTNSDPPVLEGNHHHQEIENLLDNSRNEPYDDFKNPEHLTKKKINLSLKSVNHLSEDNLYYDKTLAYKRQHNIKGSVNDTEFESISLKRQNSTDALVYNGTAKRTKTTSSHRKSAMSDSSSEQNTGEANRSKSSKFSRKGKSIQNSEITLRESVDEVTDKVHEKTSQKYIEDPSPVKVDTTSRPENLRDLIRQEALRLDSTDVTFGLEDISDSEDIWTMDIPKTVDPMHLVGQTIFLGGKSKFKIGKEYYKAFSRKSHSSLSCILNTGRTENPYRAVNINPVGSITMRKKLSNVSCVEMTITKKPTVPFPKNLKVRHPLLGADHQNKVTVTAGRKTGVSKAEIKEHSNNKAGKSREECGGWNHNNRMAKTEVFPTQKKCSDIYKSFSEPEKFDSIRLTKSYEEKSGNSEDYKKQNNSFLNESLNRVQFPGSDSRNLLKNEIEESEVSVEKSSNNKQSNNLIKVKPLRKITKKLVLADFVIKRKKVPGGMETAIQSRPMKFPKKSRTVTKKRLTKSYEEKSGYSEDYIKQNNSFLNESLNRLQFPGSASRNLLINEIEESEVSVEKSSNNKQSNNLIKVKPLMKITKKLVLADFVIKRKKVPGGMETAI